MLPPLRRGPAIAPAARRLVGKYADANSDPRGVLMQQFLRSLRNRVYSCRSSAASSCGARRLRCAHLPDTHLAQRVAYGMHGVAHFVGTDRPDAADAERLDLRELPRVEDEALVAHKVVELLEGVARVGRRV